MYDVSTSYGSANHPAGGTLAVIGAGPKDIVFDHNTVDFRIASSGAGGTVHLTLDGADVTGAVTLPDTGGWGTWNTISRTGVALAAGSHVLKLVIGANGWGGTAADINWIAVH